MAEQAQNDAIDADGLLSGDVPLDARPLFPQEITDILNQPTTLVKRTLYRSPGFFVMLCLDVTNYITKIQPPAPGPNWSPKVNEHPKKKQNKKSGYWPSQKKV